MKKRTLLRVFAIFFAVETLVNVCLPTITYALTAGPTAPEYTSFEPVDTTDMVNLATGDFVYNLPVINIPGPAGGYPLSMSYHSGIRAEQEASWVGLGFTLNAGAINRTVNVNADDVFGAESQVNDKWSGGETSYYNLGYGLPGVMAGVTFAQDTYRGSSMGTSLSLGISLSNHVNVGITANTGLFGQNSLTASAGMSASSGSGGNSQALSATLSASKTWDMNSSSSSSSAGAGISVSSKGISMVGASIGSSGGSMSFGGGGLQLPQVNKNSDNVTSISSGFNIDIPTPIGVFRFGQHKERYYIDESSLVNNYGALYTDHTFDAENNSFDSYPIFDAEHGISEDPEKYSIGSLPAYDDYNVLGQGVGGMIQPYNFDNSVLYRQNDNEVTYRELDTGDSRKINYRFKSEFSNYHLVSLPSLKYENEELTGFNDDRVIETPLGAWSSSNDQLAGSSHVEWYTNDEINLGHATTDGLIRNTESPHVTTFNDGATDYDISKQVGGYKVINNSGVTYHYAQPVYAYGQYAKSSSVDDSQGAVTHERKSLHPYAYTWLLTTLTGPDYFDKNGNGIADEGDWGYWVSFDYGKWADSYRWRNPYSGNNIDLQQNVQSRSWGKKELYYLNAVQTASHTAIFSKSIRNDGKGHSPTAILPTSTLRLNDIYLYKNDQLDFTLEEIKTTDSQYQHNQPVGGAMIHNGHAVIDERDINQLDVTGYIKKVHFGYTEYTLCDETPNSYDLNYDNPGVISVLEKTGKLTLNSLTTYGHKAKGTGDIEENNIIPPISFGYTDNNPDYDSNARDMWGFYKSDRRENIVDENVDRMTTSASKMNVDAWSLSEISMPTGSKIKVEFESDDYARPKLMRGGFDIESVEVLDEATGKIKLHLEPRYVEALSSFTNAAGQYQGGPIDFNLLLAHPQFWWDTYWDLEEFMCVPKTTRRSSDFEVFTTSSPIYPSSVDAEGIILYSTEAVSKVFEIKQNDDEYDCPYNDSVQKGLPCNQNERGPCFGTVADRVYDGAGNNQEAMFISGFLKMDIDQDVPGGGLRVKQLTLEDPTNSRQSITRYEYKTGDESSGVTSYEPNNLGYHSYSKPGLDPNYFPNLLEGIKEYRNKLMDERKALQQMRNIPGPGVFYSQVTTREFSKTGNEEAVELPSYTVNKFKVFDQDKTVKFKINPVEKSSEDTDLLTSTTVIEDLSSRIGRPNSTHVYSTSGDLISYIKNIWEESYKPDLDSEARIGQMEQSFYEYKSISGIRKIYEISDDPYDNKKVIKEINNPNLVHRTKRVEIPNYLEQVTTYMKKTGLKTTTKHVEFDVFSGQVLKTLSTDGYGNTYIAESTPAYFKYPGMGLAINGGANMLTQSAGSKTYKVLSAEDYTPVGLVNASAQTWSGSSDLLNEFEGKEAVLNISMVIEDSQPVFKYKDVLGNLEVGDQIYGSLGVMVIGKSDYSQGTVLSKDASNILEIDWQINGSGITGDHQIKTFNGVWRKKASYSWIGDENLANDGLFDYGRFDKFNGWQSGVANSLWQKNGEVTLFDTYSHALEATDVNGKYAATKMDNKQEQVYATVANASYDEFCYSGAEDDVIDGELGGDVLNNGTLENTSSAHSGTWVVSATAGNQGFSFEASTQVDRTYRVSVWSSEQDAIVASNSSEEMNLKAVKSAINPVTGATWYLLRGDVKASESNLTVWSEAGATTTLFDDFRFHPIDAAMISYVYNEWGELSHILDANNIFTQYIYDEMGRLKEVHKETFDHGVVKVSETNINYASQY